MSCIDPRTVGFTADGKITFSPSKSSRELAPFQLPCGQCLECRLDYAREWAVRCVHESKMHTKNSFITLTYDNEHLVSSKLIYSDFQKFMKKLRKTQNDPMGVFVTGEYGDKNKRPHWHAIIFGYEPSDKKFLRQNELGDKIYNSENLTKLWGKGIVEFGDVTLRSAGYCARYAAKKLVHGRDADHSWHPISKKSSKHAIGKKWLEKNFADVFTDGRLILRNERGECQEIAIPRYYERWFKEHHPDLWIRYVTQVKPIKNERAQTRSEKEKNEWVEELHRRLNAGRSRPKTPNEVRKIIKDQKFKQLQDYLKL